MPATQLATKATKPDSPLAGAQFDQEQARAEVERLTKAIAAHRSDGIGFDQPEDAALVAARETALKRLRATDLDVEEQKAAADAPIPARVLEKIRVMRRKTHDAHAALIVRMHEARHQREHLQALRSAIDELRRSPEFIHDERELRRVFRGDAGAHAVTTRSGKRLAQLERALELTTTETALAATAQAEAEVIWQGSKATLDNWEQAIRASSPAAARTLAELPQPGASVDMGLNPGAADIEIGHGKYSTKAMTP